MQELSTAHVQSVLDEILPGTTIRIFDESTATSQLAADAIGCELGQIVKSLAFIVDGQPILVLASGDQRIETRKIAAMYNVGRKKVKTARPEECIAIYGYAPGGVPPVAHRSSFPTYIDESLGRYEQLYAAGGAADAIFPITFAQLLAVTGGQVADVRVDE
jgi:prolyl-tRNA editing enzyme YbaK/EbsC (Cys-tRNA(Pro) deacylase)